MLRDTKQRTSPVTVRRWALRCGGGLLLGAGICAAATGTAHADSGIAAADLGSQVRTAVGSLIRTPQTPGPQIPTADKAASPVSKPNPKPATKIIKVTPPRQPVGRHRAPAGTAKHLLSDGVGTVAKVSGTLRQAVDQARPAQQEHPAAGTRVAVTPVRPATPRIPQIVTPSTGRMQLVQLPARLDLANLLSGAGQELPPALGPPALNLPALNLPALNLPALNLPALLLRALPELGLPELPGLPVLPTFPGVPALPVAPALPVLTLPGAAGPGISLAAELDVPFTTSQGPAGMASRHLSRVALPDAPSAPAAPRGPLPTGPVPALPAGTGAGATSHPTTAWTEPATIAGLTPSGRGTLLTGFAGPAPRDRAGMPSITPD